MTAPTQRPLYLRPPLAPVPDETEARDLEVVGAIPPELDGRYVRNGPNPLPGRDPGHWLVGHGMLHGIRLQNGQAKWYRNRWVRTKALEGAPLQREDGSLDLAAVQANTSLVRHGGKLLALIEVGLPYVVTPDLETVGPEDFDGKLSTAMTAHPKLDPVTGELHAFGYQPREPFLVYYKLSATGDLVTCAALPGARPTMKHDFAITDRHAIFIDTPVVFDPVGAPSSAFPYRYDQELGARIGVMPLDSPGTIRWFEMGTTTVFHTGNAQVTGDGGRIEIIAAGYEAKGMAELWPAMAGDPCGIPSVAAANTGQAVLYRWTIDLTSHRVTRTTLLDEGIEFPMIDETRLGRANRYTYAVAGTGPIATSRGAIIAYDAERDETAAYELGANVVAGETVFVASADPQRGENDGWLLTISVTRDGRASELLILDAGHVEGGPVARIRLPRGVPHGFHGAWLPQMPNDPV